MTSRALQLGDFVDWIRDRALTLVLMAMFLVFLAAQFTTGLYEYNATQAEHGQLVRRDDGISHDRTPMGGSL